MSVEAFYSLYAHYQLVSGFTNTNRETTTPEICIE